MYVVFCENWWRNRRLRQWSWFMYTLDIRNAKFYRNEEDAREDIVRVDRFFKRTKQEKRIWNRVDIIKLDIEDMKYWNCFHWKQWYAKDWSEIPVAIIPDAVPIDNMYEVHKVWYVSYFWNDWIIEYWACNSHITKWDVEAIRLKNKIWWKFSSNYNLVYYRDLTEKQKKIINR